MRVRGGGEGKRSYVRDVFTAIAPRYDFLNHRLSLNIDRRWRRRAVARLGWERRPDGLYLDLCAGTLDLAAALASAAGFRGRIIGADFVIPMLERGRGKSAAVRPVGADALELPFPDGGFDGALVGFGVHRGSRTGDSPKPAASSAPGPGWLSSSLPRRSSRPSVRRISSTSGGCCR